MFRGLVLREFQNVTLQLYRAASMKEAVAAGVRRPSKFSLHKKKFKLKPKLPSVDVFKGMSIAQLAAAMDIPDRRVLEASAQICPEHFSGKDAELEQTLPTMNLFHKVASIFGYSVCYTKNEEERTMDKDEYPRPLGEAKDLKPRAPVVTIMGHVDHGKTTLLDALRQSRIVDTEFGGITQHIGAFSVSLPSLPNTPRITFLDTPGHAAFSAMRERGASCTDLVVLVIAADDGVMPQTEESIQFAAAARVPIIIAINKMDAPKADMENTLNELIMKTPLLPEGHGGDVQCVPISALKRHNLDALQEAIVTQAELMELRSEMEGPVEAVVLEAHSEKGRGKVATCLIRRGCLEKGSSLIAGTAVCRVRTIYNEMGQRVEAARPSDPVEVVGWRELPFAGDLLLEVKNESRANEVQRYRKSLLQSQKQEKDFEVYKESMSSYKKRYDDWREKLINRGYTVRARNALKAKHYPDRDLPTIGDGPPKLHIVIKGDVQGSVEALLQTLGQVQGSNFELCIVASGVGEVTESEIEVAKTFDAIIYAFNVPPNPKVRELADAADVQIRDFNVIYHLANDVRDEITSIIPDQTKLELLGTANVLQIFQVSKEGSRNKMHIAGCFCDFGMLQHDAIFRIFRQNDNTGRKVDAEKGHDEEALDEAAANVIFEGPCVTIYHKKEKMNVIRKNSECGIRFDGPDGEAMQLIPGDRIECYEEVKVPQECNIQFDFDGCNKSASVGSVRDGKKS